MEPDERLLLTASEAAKALAVGRSTLARVRRAGILESVYLTGRSHPRFRRSDIEELAGVRRSKEDG